MIEVNSFKNYNNKRIKTKFALKHLFWKNH